MSATTAEKAKEKEVVVKATASHMAAVEVQKPMSPTSIQQPAVAKKKIEAPVKSAPTPVPTAVVASSSRIAKIKAL